MTGTSNDPISLIVAHPNVLLREGIAAVLRDNGFQVLGQAETMQDVRQLVATHDPNLVLFDWGVPGVDLNTVGQLVNEAPRAGVVLLTQPRTPGILLATMQVGVRGWLSVNLEPADFVEALRLLNKGNIVVAPEVTDGLKAFWAVAQPSRHNNGLSDREVEVLVLVARGSTNREIGTSLVISPHTVKVHLRHILEKLRVRNRQEAAAHAVQLGLTVDAEPEEPGNRESERGFSPKGKASPNRRPADRPK